MRRLWMFLLCLTVASAAYAAVGNKGSAHVESGTSDFERNFVGRASHLTIYPHSADVEVIHKPHYANADTFIVRSGSTMNWDDLGIYGFKVIRTTATAVDVYWW